MAAIFMIVASTIAFRLRGHSRVVAGFGHAAAVLLLFGSSSIPWLMLVFPVWVLLVSINIVVLSYRTPVRLAEKVPLPAEPRQRR
jgi:hypothetical protein